MTTRPPAPSSTRLPVVALVAALCFVLVTQVCSEAYYGKLIGKLSELHHGVSGEVYAVDSRTLFIKDFTYDGEGPAAYFYAGNSKSPNGNGFRVRDEHGTTNVLKKYRKKGITLSLPDGKNLNNIRWFSVWCDEFSVNFGDVKIPRDFDHPKPQKLAALSGAHGVSSEPVVVVDAQTLLIPSFSYDGEAPDAKFWAGTGPSPSPQGIRIPDENGKERPLRRYNRKTIVLTLPGDLTVHQLGHFGVWCEAFTVDFGHVQIPQGLNVPPSLKMLGVSPQSKLNCEVLEDSLAFEVRWAVAGDSIVVQLVGKLDAGQYMSFGLSAYPNKSVMVGGDVVVAWVDKQTLQGYAIDYFLDAKSQCAGGRGSCPDNRIQENTDSVRLLNAAMVNGYSIVTYQRPLKASDELDLQILTNVSQAIIWAIGPLNERQEVSFHTNYLKTDHFIEFGRPPAWNCPMPDQEQPSPYDNNEKGSVNQELVVTTRRPRRLPATPAPAPKTYAWDIPPIECDEPDDGVFFAQMGPTGGKHGYPAITGHVGWGISWYINGLLIPEINVVRGKTYTFYVEAGEDVETPARYHPFYITDDPIGGYLHKTPEEKAKVKIFAGVRRQRGSVEPTGTGRFCNWVPDPDQPLADEFATFGAYQRTLTLVCEPGEPGLVQWTPDENTPDTVYYQCFTHRYLGWKINVHDTCDRLEPSASENHEVYVKPNGEKPLDDLETGSSIRVPSKTSHSMTIPSFSIPPRTTFLEKKKSIYKHPSMNLRVTSDKAPYGASLQLIKLMKLDTKQTGRLEAKISESSPLDNYGNLLDSIKPARNTGFDPGSIVIEGGFKPIIRNVERRTGMPQRKMLEGSRLEDVLEQDNPTVRSIDNFAPVFVPSPPVSILETGKKLRKKMVTARNAKSRLDEIDDMMMAADRVDAYYLPPTSSGKLGELPSSSSGVLITFDGKKLKDSSLARSISGIEDRPATGLSSDVLSRTPQFGRFKGELPPPIPGEIRPSDSSQSEKRGHPSADLSVPEVPSRKNTKLTLVSRSKRSPIKATISSTDFRGNNTYRIETTGHQHGTIYESDADRNTLTLASTGRAILANLGYIVLATFFYFVV